jgi:subtilisin family serine protease
MQDFAPDDNALDSDSQKHGTNVAGIIATVAPGVKLISLDVFGASGGGSWSDLINAVNWAVSNRDVYNITAINLSLGGGSSAGERGRQHVSRWKAAVQVCTGTACFHLATA